MLREVGLDALDIRLECENLFQDAKLDCSPCVREQRILKILFVLGNSQGVHVWCPKLTTLEIQRCSRETSRNADIFSQNGTISRFSSLLNSSCSTQAAQEASVWALLTLWERRVVLEKIRSDLEKRVCHLWKASTSHLGGNFFCFGTLTLRKSDPEKNMPHLEKFPQFLEFLKHPKVCLCTDCESH